MTSTLMKVLMPKPMESFGNNPQQFDRRPLKPMGSNEVVEIGVRALPKATVIPQPCWSTDTSSRSLRFESNPEQPFSNRIHGSSGPSHSQNRSVPNVYVPASIVGSVQSAFVSTRESTSVNTATLDTCAQGPPRGAPTASWPAWKPDLPVVPVVGSSVFPSGSPSKEPSQKCDTGSGGRSCSVVHPSAFADPRSGSYSTGGVDHTAVASNFLRGTIGQSGLAPQFPTRTHSYIPPSQTQPLASSTPIPMSAPLSSCSFPVFGTVPGTVSLPGRGWSTPTSTISADAAAAARSNVSSFGMSPDKIAVSATIGGSSSGSVVSAVIPSNLSSNNYLARNSSISSVPGPTTSPAPARGFIGGAGSSVPQSSVLAGNIPTASIAAGFTDLPKLQTNGSVGSNPSSAVFGSKFGPTAVPIPGIQCTTPGVLSSALPHSSIGNFSDMGMARLPARRQLSSSSWPPESVTSPLRTAWSAGTNVPFSSGRFSTPNSRAGSPDAVSGTPSAEEYTYNSTTGGSDPMMFQLGISARSLQQFPQPQLPLGMPSTSPPSLSPDLDGSNLKAYCGGRKRMFSDEEEKVIALEYVTNPKMRLRELVKWTHRRFPNKKASLATIHTIVGRHANSFGIKNLKLESLSPSKGGPAPKRPSESRVPSPDAAPSVSLSESSPPRAMNSQPSNILKNALNGKSAFRILRLPEIPPA